MLFNLVRTRQNNVHIFSKFCLWQSNEQTNRYIYKTPDVVNTSSFISKFDLCECGTGSVWKRIFKSDIRISVYYSSCFIYVCPFIALLKAKFAKNVHIVLSSHYIAFIWTSCVFWFVSLNANSNSHLCFWFFDREAVMIVYYVWCCVDLGGSVDLIYRLVWRLHQFSLVG